MKLVLVGVLLFPSLGGCDRLFARHERAAFDADEDLRRHCSAIRPGERLEQPARFHFARTERGWDITGDGYSRCTIELDGERVRTAGWLPD